MSLGAKKNHQSDPGPSDRSKIIKARVAHASKAGGRRLVATSLNSHYALYRVRYNRS